MKGCDYMCLNIEAEIARMRWSKADFAKEMKVSIKTVYNWLNGVNDIPSGALMKMSKLFNCTTDYLLGLDDSA